MSEQTEKPAVGQPEEPNLNPAPKSEKKKKQTKQTAKVKAEKTRKPGTAKMAEKADQPAQAKQKHRNPSTSGMNSQKPQEPKTQEGASGPREKQKQPPKQQEQPVKPGKSEKVRHDRKPQAEKTEPELPAKPKENLHRRMILNCEELETRFALLENGRLEEYELERPSEGEIVPGSIYLGRITRLEPSLEAAFVDIGAEKNAFLHYHDMLPASYDMLDNIRKIDEQVQEAAEAEQESIRSKSKGLLSAFSRKLRTFMGRTDKAKRLKELEEKVHSGKISVADIPKVFPVGSEILVQVTKGPIGTKGARVTTNITIPGRYLVLLPYSRHLGLSSRIDDKRERDRLRRIMQQLDLPDGMGLICRTVGEGRRAIFFERDVEMLLELWQKVENALEQPKAPLLVHKEPTLLERTIRDLLTDDVEEIAVDDQEKYDMLKNAVARMVGSDFQTKITLHNRAEPIFERYNVSEQAAAIFNRIAPLPSGGYLCIDETEALIAIDINSGKAKNAREQPEMILKTNLEAAAEIARQMRLRNIGGQVVIDFIDMASSRDRDLIFNTMNRLLDRDHARTKVLPISRFGLMELTRQREHESVQDVVYDLCPYCNGSGHVKSAISMSVEIQRRLKEILKRRARSRKAPGALRVIMHPTILARLKNDDAALLRELESQYGKELQFRADASIHIEEFKLVDPETNQSVG